MTIPSTASCAGHGEQHSRWRADTCRLRRSASAGTSAYHSVMTTTELLPFTGDPEADRLLVEDPLALLIGFVLDQQVTLQKAFSGPLELSRRIGGLDARRNAAVGPDAPAAAFRGRAAPPRVPAN